MANDSIVARKMFGLHGLTGRDAGVKTTGGLMYYNYDGLRNVSELTDRNGGIIEQYRYDAFGGLYTGVTAPYNTAGFASQSYDPKAGLVDMHACWYAPQTGRFTAPDTYRGDLLTPYTQNRYAYVGNNPINRWDPTGNWEDGDSTLSSQAQAAIHNLTDQYNATDDLDERARLHAQAESIRSLDRTRYYFNTETLLNSWSDSNTTYNSPVYSGGTVYTAWTKIQNYYSLYGIYSNARNAYTNEIVSTTLIGSRTDTTTVTTTGTDTRPYTAKEWYAEHKGELNEYGTPPSTKTNSVTVTTKGKEVLYSKDQIVAIVLDKQDDNVVIIEDEQVPLGHDPDDPRFNKKGTGNSESIDLSKLKPEDITRAIAEWLIESPEMVFATQHPYVTQALTGVNVLALFYAAGFVMDSDGVFHSRQEWSIQSFKYSGFNDFYDMVFHYATDMDKAKFEFTSGGKDYILWAWKGDYLNLGAGAEMGIYTRMGDTEHWLVDQSLAMPMTLKLDYNGNTIISYDPKIVDPQISDPLRKSTDKWWVTGFNPDYQDKKASELTATYTATFNTQSMYDDFSNKYGNKNSIYYDPRWTFDPKTITGTLKF